MRIAVLALVILFVAPCYVVSSKGLNARPDLDIWYATYNEVYFSDRLPKNTVLDYDNLGHDDCGETFQRLDGGFTILISPNCNVTEAEVVLTLVHEMVHVDQFYTNHDIDGHGPLFENEMEDLAKMGAFRGVW